MNFIEFFLQEAGIEDSKQKEVLKLQITLNSLGLAITKIHPHLSEEEHNLVKEFLANPSQETSQKVQPLFLKPECQEAMADATLEVMREMIDDPEIIQADRREKLLSNLEAWLVSKQQVQA